MWKWEKKKTKGRRGIEGKLNLRNREKLRKMRSGGLNECGKRKISVEEEERERESRWRKEKRKRFV